MMSERNDFIEATQSLATTIEAGTAVEVRVGVPGATSAEYGIDVHLLGIRQQTRERHRAVVLFPLELDHLVAIGADGEESSGLLHDVLAAIEGSARHQLSLDDVPVDWWTAFGVTPRPAVRVRTPVRLDRAVAEAPVVTEELIVEHAFHQPAPSAEPTLRKA